jgi:DNA-binding LacI/PurR family transcriptional regulator
VQSVSVTTIKDVAQRAGVSVSTVSHALSGKRPVSDETRARIFQAIAELGYQPSVHAQSLVTGYSRTIGILFPLEGSGSGPATLNTIQLEMIMEANAVAQSNGYSLQLFTQAEDASSLRALCRTCDGLLVSMVRLHDPRVDYLLKERYPFVMMGRPEQANHVAWVDTDFEDMVMKQIAHLVELNHRRIVFLDRPERLFEKELGYTVRVRYGYLQACKAFSLTPIICSCEVSVEDGRRTMHQILNARPDITAMAAFNDVAAVGAYYALPERGLRAPDDFSIIAFTSPGFLQATMPSMTAMNNTGSMVSRVAAELLLNQLQGGAVESRQILIKSELIPGKTTGLAPTMRKRARKRNVVQ